MVKELIDVRTSTRIINISGFVGNPSDARKSAGNQFFFVNGRYFRSPYFHKALMKAYDSLIPEGAYPSYYIFFETSPENVDVNIHPAKTEVKFENETEIFEILTAAVKESLGRNSFIPTLHRRLQPAAGTQTAAHTLRDHSAAGHECFQTLFLHGLPGQSISRSQRLRRHIRRQRHILLRKRNPADIGKISRHHPPLRYDGSGYPKGQREDIL